MKYSKLGRSSLKVSKLCLGTVNFGFNVSKEDSIKIMDRAFEEGINFFDTADTYGYSLFSNGYGEGLTEEIIGDWFKKGNGRREKTIIATKCYGSMGKGINDKGLSAYRIKKCCEESLKRMNIDHIDIFYMHHIDRESTWEELFQAMEQLVREGKIIYMGSSNFAAWDIATAQMMAKSRNFLGITVDQSMYNLTQRNIELELIPVCRNFGIGLTTYSPLRGGILAGDSKNKSRRKLPEAVRNSKRFENQLKAYEGLCGEIGESMAAIAFAWINSNKSVMAPIIGVRTLSQLENSIKTLEIDLSDDFLKKLDEIWPGPGGEAPEAYIL